MKQTFVLLNVRFQIKQSIDQLINLSVNLISSIKYNISLSDYHSICIWKPIMKNGQQVLRMALTLKNINKYMILLHSYCYTLRLETAGCKWHYVLILVQARNDDDDDDMK